MISVGEIDPELQKALAGMISSGEIHPDSAELSCRDDFRRENAS